MSASPRRRRGAYGTLAAVGALEVLLGWATPATACIMICDEGELETELAFVGRVLDPGGDPRFGPYFWNSEVVVTTAIKGVAVGQVVRVHDAGGTCGHPLFVGATYLLQFDEDHPTDMCGGAFRLGDVVWAGTPPADYDFGEKGPYLWLPMDLARVQYAIDRIALTEGAPQSGTPWPFPSAKEFELGPLPKECIEASFRGREYRRYFDLSGSCH